MPWIRRRLRGNDVWVRTDASGKPVSGSDGRVDVVYKLSASAKVYRAGLRNLEKTGDSADETPREAPDGDPTEAATRGKNGGKKSGGRSRRGSDQVNSAAELPTPDMVCHA